MRNQALAQLFANAQQLGHAGQYFPAVAVHGQSLGLPPRIKAALLHLLAANAHRRCIRPALTQAIKQQGGEQIARGLTRHHGNAGRYGVCSSLRYLVGGFRAIHVSIFDGSSASRYQFCSA